MPLIYCWGGEPSTHICRSRRAYDLCTELALQLDPQKHSYQAHAVRLKIPSELLKDLKLACWKIHGVDIPGHQMVESICPFIRPGD